MKQDTLIPLLLLILALTLLVSSITAVALVHYLAGLIV